jgi:hypothetical protein
MYRRRKNQISRAELLDTAKALEFRGIDDLDFQGPHFNVAVNGVAD